MRTSESRIIFIGFIATLAWFGMFEGLPIYDLRIAKASRLIRSEDDVKRGKRLAIEILLPTSGEQSRGW